MCRRQQVETKQNPFSVQRVPSDGSTSFLGPSILVRFGKATLKTTLVDGIGDTKLFLRVIRHQVVDQAISSHQGLNGLKRAIRNHIVLYDIPWQTERRIGSRQRRIAYFCGGYVLGLWLRI